MRFSFGYGPSSTSHPGHAVNGKELQNRKGWYWPAMTTEWQKLNEERKKRSVSKKPLVPLAPEVARARHVERTKRYMAAKLRTATVMKYRHPDEWRELFDDELRQLYVERGPLPGDE
jgi:hypothetical protein